jgi:hypothetical protein
MALTAAIGNVPGEVMALTHPGEEASPDKDAQPL